MYTWVSTRDWVEISFCRVVGFGKRGGFRVVNKWFLRSRDVGRDGLNNTSEI